jgi:YbbR domain-containing protein
MNKLKKLLLDHWAAKIISLALAVTLWAVIKKSIGTTTLPSRIQFETERRPQIDFSTNAAGKK